MRGLILGLVCGALALPLLRTQAARADELARVKERGVLVVGVKNDYPPFGYLDANGNLRGFEVDLANGVAKQLLGPTGKVEFVPVVASNRIEFLNAGRIDVIFATLGQTAERAKVIDFTTPYYMMAGMVLLAPKTATFKSWDDVRGHKLCGIQGNLYNRQLTEKFGADMLLFVGTAEMFNAFTDHRCEAIAFDGPILQQKVNEPVWRDNDQIAVGAFELIPISGGVRKDEKPFLDAVNSAITATEAAGTLVAAEHSYGMGETPYVQDQAAKAKAAAH
jgi:polar amino acid transport system substrate-binding protein